MSVNQTTIARRVGVPVTTELDRLHTEIRRLRIFAVAMAAGGLALAAAVLTIALSLLPS